MAQTFYLRLLLTGQDDDLICEVRESESDRLKDLLASEAGLGRFFWFDTINGRSILVNTEHLQGVRYLWDIAAGPPDSRVDPDEGMNIVLLGKEPISEPPSEDPKDVFTLFWELELGDAEAVTFTDVDGEAFTLIAHQIVYLSAPKKVVDEGRRQAEAEDEG